MFGKRKDPIDRTPHPRSPDSRRLVVSESPGLYVYAVDEGEVIHVVPDGPHVHPTILGLARPALYAGEIEIEASGVVGEVNNLSGTFQFRSKRSLLCVAGMLVDMGFSVRSVIWYPPDGATTPKRLVFLKEH